MKFDIIKAMNMIREFSLAFLGLIVVIMISLIITGVLIYSTSSGIQMDNATAHALNQTAQVLTGLWTTVTSAVQTTVGLVVLVVVLIIFGAFLYVKKKGQKKSGSAY